MAKVRIQKVLAASGLASRRAVEEMVLEGRISVNGDVVTSLPCFVEPRDEILVDGSVVRKRAEEHVYFLLNKPRGVICTQRDETGRNRPRAVDLVPAGKKRLYCVGRLDEDSTGLIVLTNDGELTNRLTHPSYGIIKTYRVRVAGRISGEEMARLRSGVYVGPRKTGPANVKLLRGSVNESLLEMRISEGRNRQVRRMLASLGHNVHRLHRAAIGPINDKRLKIGHYRQLTPAEISNLLRATEAPAEGGESTVARSRPKTRARPKRKSAPAPRRKPTTKARPKAGAKPRRKAGARTRPKTGATSRKRPGAGPRTRRKR